MAEFAHHINWLSDARIALEVGKYSRASLRSDQLLQWLETCENVLAQNPTSAMASSLKIRIEELLREESSAPPPEKQVFEEGWGMNDASVERMDSIIAKTEQNFALLHADMSEKLARSPERSNLLMLPLDYVRNNVDFPHKNGLRVRLQSHRAGIPHMIAMQNGHFLYDLLPDSVLGMNKGKTHIAVASFNAQYRMFQMDVRFDPQRLLDLFVAYHEVLHARQDDWLRTSVDAKSYTRLTEKEPGTIIDFEHEAFAYTLEGIDLYLEGEFRTRCMTRKEDATSSWLHETLQGSEEFHPLTTGLVQLGKKLWEDPHFRFDGSFNYPTAFRYKINEDYSQMNVLYCIEDGMIRKMGV